METSGIKDNRVYVWNNLLNITFNTLFFAFFPVGLIWVFIDDTKHIQALWVGIVLLWLVYELFVYTYIRATLRDGVLFFERPLGKYGFLFRRRTRQMTIHPDDWTEVYRYSFKGGTAYYFRKDKTAAYFVSADGFRFFYDDLERLFPGKVKHTDDFPREMRKKLRKKERGRVF
nr:hypothetical protein [uncultured Fluviicola sp.]